MPHVDQMPALPPPVRYVRLRNKQDPEAARALNQASSERNPVCKAIHNRAVGLGLLGEPRLNHLIDATAENVQARARKSGAARRASSKEGVFNRAV